MRLFLCLIILSQTALAQISKTQQQALNSHVDYANQSAKEVALVTESLKRYYESLSHGKTWSTQRYSCPVQPEDYYYKNALKSGAALNIPQLTKKLNDLKLTADSIDGKCKALDTYYKLEDFKKDSHEQGEALVKSVPPLMKSYRTKQRELQSQLEMAYEKFNKSLAQNAYIKADASMRQQIVKEQALLDLWNLNANEAVYTGWPSAQILESNVQTDSYLAQLKKIKPDLKYPASSMWASFQESLLSLLEEKRRGVDEFNYEAKKSDKHSNDVYMNLINYFNGTLVSNYNTFIEFSERDQYFGLKFIQYFPSFQVKEGSTPEEVSNKVFTDREIPQLTISPQQTVISESVFHALTNYVDFINETWRQTRYMQAVLTSFNSSASYYRNLDSFEKRAPMHFDFQDYIIPRSAYQKATADSKALPAEISAILNTQCEVLLEVLQEMDNVAAHIDVNVKNKAYEQDHLDLIFEKLQREKTLLDLWDEKKEKLFNDVKSIYASYQPKDVKDSWYVSGNALSSLVVLDHAALFTAKQYYGGDSLIKISTV
jgi:Ca-activated chloride channel homolog